LTRKTFEIKRGRHYLLLTQGFKALVTKRGFKKEGKHKWCAKKSMQNWYAVRGVYDTKTKKVKIVRLHRELLNYHGPNDVNHINGNTMDYRERNLEIATHAENMENVQDRQAGEIADKKDEIPF